MLGLLAWCENHQGIAQGSGAGKVTVTLAQAEAIKAEAKAKALPTVDSMRELFVRFDYNKNKMLSLAELDKVQLAELAGGG